MDRTKYLKNIKRVVIKVGTSLLLAKDQKKERQYFGKLMAAINELRGRGIQVFLVSSGAIGLGMRALGVKKRPQDVAKQQALAAVGQNRLMAAYQEAAEKYLIQVSQVLLTYDDISNRRRYINARRALAELAKYGALPVINENDTVATEEVRAGDNDRLSAMVANLVDAQLLVILSDVEGLYDRHPGEQGGVVISEVESVTRGIKQLARGKGSEASVGGMLSKLDAVEIVVRDGKSAVIAGGSSPRIVADILDGKQVGTFFKPLGKRISSRKSWISALHSKGSLLIDGGATRALKNGKSLLPSGVTEAQGKFCEGDLVTILDSSGNEIARGLTKFSCDDLKKIFGKRTKEAARILGVSKCDEVIHRDDLLVLGD